MTYTYSKTFNATRRLNSGSRFTCQCGWKGRLTTCKEVSLSTDPNRPNDHLIYLCPYSHHILGEDRLDGGPIGMLEATQGPEPISSADYFTLMATLGIAASMLQSEQTRRLLSERPTWRTEIDKVADTLDDYSQRALAQASKMRSKTDPSPNETA